MYIKTEETPNPNSVKFIPNRSISPESPIYFKKATDADNTFLGRKLFLIEGVESVFYGRDFITVTKKDSSSWEIIKREIVICIMDHFSSGLDVFDEIPNKEKDFKSSTRSNVDGYIKSNKLYSDIEKQIIDLIDHKVRPSVAMDGGDIAYKGFEDGIVKLELRGACSGCPSSTITLKNGIEAMLKHYVPEVTSVEAYEE